MKDFDDVCKSHKACAIAILPAITTIDYEADNFAQKLAMLEKADEQSGRVSSPVHYTWLNATCHVSKDLQTLLTLCVYSLRYSRTLRSIPRPCLPSSTCTSSITSTG